MGSTLDIPVPATSQLIGTDCIPTAIIRRRHQKFHTDAKRVRFHIRGLRPGHNATVLRLYSDDKESFWLYSDSNYARTVFWLQLSGFEYSRNTAPKLDRSDLRIPVPFLRVPRHFSTANCPAQIHLLRAQWFQLQVITKSIQLRPPLIPVVWNSWIVCNLQQKPKPAP